MNSNPFGEAIDKRLEQIVPGLSCSLDRLHERDSETICRAIDVLLEYACCSQNAGNITEARRRLTLLSPILFDVKVRERVNRVLDLTDEWEYRRLMELLHLLRSSRFREFLELGAGSEVAGIREAASDMSP